MTFDEWWNIVEHTEAAFSKRDMSRLAFAAGLAARSPAPAGDATAYLRELDHALVAWRDSDKWAGEGLWNGGVRKGLSIVRTWVHAKLGLAPLILNAPAPATGDAGMPRVPQAGDDGQAVLCGRVYVGSGLGQPRCGRIAGHDAGKPCGPGPRSSEPAPRTTEAPASKGKP